MNGERKKPFTHINPFTYGVGQAGINLVEMLQSDEHQKYAHTITAIITKCHQHLKASMFIPDKNTRSATLVYWRTHYLSIINELDVPSKIKTHSSNVIIAFYRDLIHAKKTISILS
jgi:hypothetical protein